MKRTATFLLLLSPSLLLAAPKTKPAWVLADEAELHVQTSRNTRVLGTLPRGTEVRLGQRSGAFCEVQHEAVSGYTPCALLGSEPVAPNGKPVIADPAALFWRAPGWRALEHYSFTVEEKHREAVWSGKFPRDAEFEKMKARLAEGVLAAPPPAFADWQHLKHVAEAEPQQKDAADELYDALGLLGAVHNPFADDYAKLTIGLVRALEFAPVRPSLFRSESELAPHNASAEEAGGRFSIVVRQATTTRRQAGKSDGDGTAPGVYDILRRKAMLAAPVQRLQLFRDGRLRSESSTLQKDELVWRDGLGTDCTGWKEGFAAARPEGSVYTFYRKSALPAASAAVSTHTVAMERARTGFARGTYLYYDVDKDGTADLAIWEGEGVSQAGWGGDASDQRWYRLALANIGGAWKVLGADRYSYACGPG
ncbi:hypothetical protein [Pseudoduganella sp.]|uniref:hypothetical protein n=1 Tax=Pseudoduganella sp. TaxID=1880898 RepID=UPI0035AF9050